MLPSAARPKLIVPSGPARVSAAALRNYNTGAGRREQLMISAAAAALRAGLSRLAPDTVWLPPHRRGSDVATGDVRTHLSAELGTPVDVALYIGPARAVRKPLLQVLDGRGNTVAFAKLGVDDFTRALVLHEAAALEELHRCAPRWVVPPPVLRRGSWHGHELLVLGALHRGAAAPADDPSSSGQRTRSPGCGRCTVTCCRRAAIGRGSSSGRTPCRPPGCLDLRASTASWRSGARHR